MRKASQPRSTPLPDPIVTGPFMRGARPSPAHKLLATPAFVADVAPPANFGRVPSRLSVWGNSQYGDCVTAEEAAALADHDPEIFIDEATVIAWAGKHGFLNGADLSEVMDAMARSGFVVGSQEYRDGPHQTVNFADEPTLQAAIYKGPVKIAIDADGLPSGAGNKQGWVAIGGSRRTNYDHCVGLPGYGTVAYLCGLLGVPVPAGVDPAKIMYELFTWATIGLVDHAWLMANTSEAHVRTPTTVGVPPLPDTTPGTWTP